MKHPFRNVKQQMQVAKEKVDEIVDHIRENKVAYLTGGACFMGGLLLASKSTKVNTTVNVVNFTPSSVPVPKPHPDIPGVYTFDNEEQSKQFLEHHFPLSMARHQKIKAGIR